jgi:prevent-host-death family protein
MREIQALEAQQELDQLLDAVERGEEIIIKRNGKKVAWLVPVAPAEPKPAASPEAIMAEFDRLREQLKLGPFNWEELKAERDDGRK